MSFQFPRKIFICPLGLILVIAAHCLLLVGEVFPHAQCHQPCKLGGYGLLLAVFIVKAFKVMLTSEKRKSRQSRRKQ